MRKKGKGMKRGIRELYFASALNGFMTGLYWALWAPFLKYELSLTNFQISLLSYTYYFGLIAVSIPLASLVDKFGRKLMIPALFSLPFAYALYFFSNNFLQVFVAEILFVVFFPTVYNPIISFSFRKGAKQREYAISSILWDLFGALGAFLSPLFKPRQGWLFLGLLSFLFLFPTLSLPEVRAEKVRMGEGFRNRIIRALFLTNLFIYFPLGFYWEFLPLLLKKMGVQDVGYVLSLVFLPSLLSGFVVMRIKERKKFIVLSAFFLSLGIATTGISLELAIPSVLMVSFLNPIFYVLIEYWAQESVHLEALRAVISETKNMGRNMGWAFGVLFFGFLSDFVSLKTSYALAGTFLLVLSVPLSLLIFLLKD